MSPTTSSTRGATPVIGARAQRNLSDCLASLLAVWDRGGDFRSRAARHGVALMYLRPSWYRLFAGMGRFPAELCSAPQAVAAARARLNQLAPGPQLPSPSLDRRVGSRRTCPGIHTRHGTI